MPADCEAVGRRSLPPALLIAGLGGLTLLSVVLFLTLGAKGSWSFILAFRGTKVAAMLLVGYAIAVSTVLFQTITNNRILTPSIMGFDVLYRLIQTVLVFQLGSAAVTAFDPRLRFGIEVGAMVAFSWLLYRWLFSGSMRGLHLLMLVGIVFGVLFRSLAGFLQRVIDPNEFLAVQDRLFASFNRVDGRLLLVSALVVLAVSVAVWRKARVLDVLALGRDAAINLGVDHRREVMQVLAIVSVLVAVSTALVGPVTFFGLLVANLAYLLVDTNRHRLVLPVAALVAMLVLICGQIVLERLLGFNGALSIVIEFLGGIVFLVILVRRAAR
ncbi:iron chelate uptake ABC transporter family permease subunit [Azospirillum sp. YIM B02556]|uniref:Iron chelate uptake ABC transporter family permease subunit n=1 Tax=Azospirillum endophyticum TaxID=2800326 RepID=A0ABS1FGZ6_9PROT|nr:iron chelate uptake ABC transporter family permease subunit [Azospirillum endophyticum]MBK1842706.1 iron chelate uptake ABC transporter family permease subunit [Azospirillum endophyticum]